MKEFAAAFVKAQKVVKIALKESENPAFKQGGKVSKYADLGSVWDACKEALTANGFCVLQPTNFEGENFWLETVLMHESGQQMTGRYPIKPAQNTPQAMGSAITYARRYALAAMLGIVTDADDDGNEASAPRPQSEPARQPAASKPGPRAVEPTAPSVAGRKIEADGIRKAREWVNAEALPAIKACKDAEALNLWVEKAGPIMEKLKTVLPEEHQAVLDKIAVKADSFNVLAAAE